MYNRYMIITNSTGNINTTTVISPKSLKNPKPPKSPRSPRKRNPRKHKKDVIPYLPKDEEELFRHLYPHFITDDTDDKDTAYTTDTSGISENDNVHDIIDNDEELVRFLFPWLLEN
jgi:hypothetical protein